MPLGVIVNSPSRYVTEELKRIVTSPTNIRRLIFFDKNDSRTTLEDKSVNGQNATLSVGASSLDPSSAGKARVLNFNASGDYWDFADADDLSFGNGTADSAFSLVACISPNRTTADTIFSKYDATSTSTQREYIFEIASNNLNAYIVDNSTGGFLERKYTTSIVGDVGSYHTYCMTYDASAVVTGIKIYRDGVQVDNASDVFGGTYTAMESKGAKAGSYRTDTTKQNIGQHKYAVMAVIAEELTQAQITAIDALFRKYVGVI